MASVSKQANGRFMVQFKGTDGKRRSVRLGTVDELTARDFGRHVEHLAQCVAHSRPPSKATDDWLSGLMADPSKVHLYDRLARVGLVQMRQAVAEVKESELRAKTALSHFLEAYIAKRRDVGASSKLLYHQTAKNLTDYFGADKQLGDISKGDATDWRLWMTTDAHEQREGGLAKSTVNRRVRCAKQFFEDAVDHDLVPSNPFRKLKGGSSVNNSRLFFVTAESTEKILEACPDAEWRAIVALVRFGGIRCPSELMPFTWADVNFVQDSLLITSPKTKHLDKPYRSIPTEVFSDVRPYLEDLFELAQARGKAKPTDHVITRYREKNSNLRTQFLRIIKLAGVEPWPKLFQNCRSSRETELIYLGHKLHEVCRWIGNSPAVADAHYLQVLNSSQKADLERSAENRAEKRRCREAMQKTRAAGGDAPIANECKPSPETRETPRKTRVL